MSIIAAIVFSVMVLLADRKDVPSQLICKIPTMKSLDK